MPDYHVLYRGPLSSCNYECSYCPFAKRTESIRDLQADRRSLRRFVDWIEQQTQHRMGVLFTPWGEALVRSWYRDAMIRLSQLKHVFRVACQTNLTFPVNWIDQAQMETIAFWATYHPTQVSLQRFVERVEVLVRKGIRLSVGVVGMKEHFSAIEQLRRSLPEHIYVWVNAYKSNDASGGDYYGPEDLAFLSQIDEHFHWNVTSHVTRGLPCYAGETSFSVDGEGTMRRCHFVTEPLGNIHDPHWESNLAPMSCPNELCGCHIGYVHFKPLKLYSLYGSGLLERIPAQFPDPK